MKYKREIDLGLLAHGGTIGLDVTQAGRSAPDSPRLPDHAQDAVKSGVTPEGASISAGPGQTDGLQPGNSGSVGDSQLGKCDPAPAGTDGRPIEILSVETLSAIAVPAAGHKVCGIYFLYQDDALVYIGQARNYLSRLGFHGRHKVGQFNRIAFISVPRTHLGAVEVAYILHHKPLLNVTIPIKVPPILPPERFWLSSREAGRYLHPLSLKDVRGKITRYIDGNKSVFDLREITKFIADDGLDRP